MPVYRSRTTTHGRNMAGARALWRATGMKDGDFEKPIIAISNSFTQFVPGHVHLKDLGQLVAREIERAGGVVVIRYEGPRGGPGMQEMLYPTSYLKSKDLGKVCALFTDGRFSGGTSGLSIGHASPEAAEGGAIGLVEEGDTIEIDIPNRTIHLVISDETMAHRRATMEAKGKFAWKPVNRERHVSPALRAYAAMTTSAARGAVRDVAQIEHL